MEKQKNKFLEYTIQDQKTLVLEWDLKPNQSFSRFQASAVRKLKTVLSELLSKDLINHEFWNCSYKVDIQSNYKIIAYID